MTRHYVYPGRPHRFLVDPEHISRLIKTADAMSFTDAAYVPTTRGDFKVWSRTDFWSDPIQTSYHCSLLSGGTPAEYPISRQEYAAARAQAACCLGKLCLTVPFGEHSSEVQIYEGAGPLVVAEVGAAPCGPASRLQTPDFYGSDITGLRGWDDASLAAKPLNLLEIETAYGLSLEGAPILER